MFSKTISFLGELSYDIVVSTVSIPHILIPKVQFPCSSDACLCKPH